MKSTHKKKKKKGTRKPSRSATGPKPVLKTDSGSAIGLKEDKNKSNQTVPKKITERKQENSNKLVKYTGIAVQFLRDAKTELKKVKWPTRKELIASTVIVIVLVLAVALFLGLIDFGLMKAIKGILG